jgi:hypothetical protein
MCSSRVNSKKPSFKAREEKYVIFGAKKIPTVL